MLYRVLLVSETVGATGRTAASVAAILGVAEYNNRRDHVGAVLLFHEGQAAQMLEGARVDLDRLIERQSRDGRHSGLRVVDDRPITHRRVTEPMRLNRLSADAAAERLAGRRLDELSAPELESLLCCDELRASRAA